MMNWFKKLFKKKENPGLRVEMPASVYNDFKKIFPSVDKKELSRKKETIAEEFGSRFTFGVDFGMLSSPDTAESNNHCNSSGFESGFGGGDFSGSGAGGGWSDSGSTGSDYSSTDSSNYDSPSNSDY